jgi:RNA polymerase sigma-70 factor (ECF subfamily)
MKRRRRKLAELEDPLEVLDSPATDEDGRFVRHVARWEQTPVDIMLDKELKKVLEDAMDGLPKLYRAVFALRDMEGKTSEETAEILNISVEAVKSRLRRARAFLRDALSPYMETHHKG